jgi:hypothetical protein
VLRRDEFHVSRQRNQECYAVHKKHVLRHCDYSVFSTNERGTAM